MKLAEALQQRADLMKRIDQLNSRLGSAALAQEGTEPPEQPADLLEELNRCCAELQDLITRINLTNSRTRLEGETLTALLARREVMAMRLNSLRNLCDSAQSSGVRMSRSEIRWIPTVNVKELRAEIDRMSAEFRRLDSAIQAANWRVDLK